MEKVSLWTLAGVFAKIGMFTLGGGYAMIPLIDREVVEKRRWLEKDEFYDILAIAQSAPGLLIVNISIFAGYRLRGRRGSVAATIGSCLPSFLIILAIALFFAGYRDNVYVDKVFKGIRPVVVALIAVPVVDIGSSLPVRAKSTQGPSDSDPRLINQTVVLISLRTET